MDIIVLERVSPSLRGELSRWFIEPATGVFVGKVSAMVRDKLWDKCAIKSGDGWVLQAWSSNNEQGCLIRTHGEAKREVLDMEGLQIVKIR